MVMSAVGASLRSADLRGLHVAAHALSHETNLFRGGGGTFTVSSRAPVRTSLRSMEADDDFGGALSAAVRVLCAGTQSRCG